MVAAAWVPQTSSPLIQQVVIRHAVRLWLASVTCWNTPEQE
jgi:hypothetical protein